MLGGGKWCGRFGASGVPLFFFFFFLKKKFFFFFVFFGFYGLCYSLVFGFFWGFPFPFFFFFFFLVENSNLIRS